MKYIDADKLIAEIERREKIHFNDYHIKGNGNPADYGACNALCQLRSFVASLQQEQTEVDLEKEIERFLESEESTSHTNAGGYDVAFKDTVKIARHFYELGLKARKEE